MISSHITRSLLLCIFFFTATQDIYGEVAYDVNVIPYNFLWGTAISEYQVSGALGCPYSNWAAFEVMPDKNGKLPIADGQFSGDACNFKKSYRSYIALMKELGINAFRFSVEWSNIEPQEGVFCQEALDFYAELCDALIDAGITPMITLHHFTDPLWFTQKGGFEKDENIFYFVRFAHQVFEHLASRITLWITFNEPTIYMFQGYIHGAFPPAKKSLLTAIGVMRNLLKAHTLAYKALKEAPGGDAVQIGIVHQYLKFYPYHSWNLLERIPGLLFNDLLNTCVLHFFKTGSFKVPLSSFFGWQYDAPYGQKLFDFIGLNYYSRVIVKGQLSFTEPLVPSCLPGEVMTDMPYAMYPQGLYDAIVEMSELGVPMYITENGIADAKDDRREQFIKEYTRALLRAFKDGYDIRGYFYWSLMDNFEWDEGYHKKFGLCHVDFDTKEATIRPGAWAYAQVIQRASLATV